MFELEQLNNTVKEQQNKLNSAIEHLASIDKKMYIFISSLETSRMEGKDFSLIDEEIDIKEEETLSGIPRKMLPELKTPEERIEYFLKRIKEIGPISKYSAIEDE